MTTLPQGCPRLSGLGDDELRAAILERIEAYPIADHPDTIVERALSYPFEPPPFSYVLNGRDVRPLAAGRRYGATDAAHAVLAYGSNGSPEALLRKFARTPEEERDLLLPVLRGTLAGFDVVYSSHLSAYGSVPATIHPAPGTAITTYVTLLTDAQLIRLMETEFNYEVRLLEDVEFRSDHGDRGEVVAFVSRHGALGIDGAPIPLGAIAREPAESRTAAPLTEPDVLERVRAHLRPDEELHDFILRNVGDPRRALAHTYELRERRIPFDYEPSRVLDA